MARALFLRPYPQLYSRSLAPPLRSSTHSLTSLPSPCGLGPFRATLGPRPTGSSPSLAHFVRSLGICVGLRSPPTPIPFPASPWLRQYSPQLTLALPSLHCVPLPQASHFSSRLSVNSSFARTVPSLRSLTSFFLEVFALLMEFIQFVLETCAHYVHTHNQPESGKFPIITLSLLVHLSGLFGSYLCYLVCGIIYW